MTIKGLERRGMENNISNRLAMAATCELVGELSSREGVEAHVAEPYKDLTVTVNGPAIVLVVTD